MPDIIPFNKIFHDQEEQAALARALANDSWHGDGPASKRVEALLCQWLKSEHAFLTTSCTHALEMAMMVLEIEKGDEVILPSFTFVSTANAVLMRGGKVVFAEIRSNDLTIDPDDLARKITPATKAVIPIHYAGVSADFDSIYQVLGKKAISDNPSNVQSGSPSEIAVVEDAAQAVGAYWKNKALGTVGDIGCFSFHDTKNFTCGEGGAFLTQKNDLARKAEWIREKGTDRSAFLRGEIDKYTWQSHGSSYIPSDLLAALLEVQLKKKEVILESRKKIRECYYERLSEARDRGWIFLPVIPDYARSNYHIFHFHVRNKSDRDPLIAMLRDEGIQAAFHYVPLHNSPYARKIMDRPVVLPRTEYLADSLIRLPLYPDLLADMEQAADRTRSVLARFFNKRR